MKSYLLVDAPMVYKAADSKLAHLKTRDGRSSGGVFGFIRSVEAMRERVQPEGVLVAFEHGGTARRAERMPEYKADRDRGAPFWREGHQEAVMAWVAASGYEVGTMFGSEADDVIAQVHAQLFEDGYEHVVIMSKDHDFRKLLGYGYPDMDTVIWMKFDEKPYGFEEFVAEHGFSPDRYLDYCCLAGDASDNIPAVIKPLAAKELVIGTNSWDEVLSELDDWPEQVKAATANRAVLRFFEGALVTMGEGRDEEALKELYREWEFNSLLKKLEAA